MPGHAMMERARDIRGANRTFPTTKRPDPMDLLGVRRWVNAYRSGDYIGRHLWRPDACAYLFGPERSEDKAGTRVEFCIGSGGHTHYWDKTARAIAEELDSLITTAGSEQRG